MALIYAGFCIILGRMEREARPEIAIVCRGPEKQEAGAVTKNELSAIYRDYIACLNGQDWPNLGKFVADQACHNGRRIGLAGYRDMLEGDYRDIPGLQFNVQLLISDPPFCREPFTVRLQASGNVPGAARQWPDNLLYRECVL